VLSNGDAFANSDVSYLDQILLISGLDLNVQLQLLINEKSDNPTTIWPAKIHVASPNAARDSAGCVYLLMPLASSNRALTVRALTKSAHSGAPAFEQRAAYAG